MRAGAPRGRSAPTPGARELGARYSDGERSAQELARFIAAALFSTATECRYRWCLAYSAQSDRTDAKGNIEAV